MRRDAWIFAALLLAAACGDDRRERRDAAATDAAEADAAGDAAAAGCMTDEDCEGQCEGAISPECRCRFESGVCGGIAHCEPGPTDCGFMTQYCGCDGVTYDGYCALYSAGVSTRSRGPCP